MRRRPSGPVHYIGFHHSSPHSKPSACTTLNIRVIPYELDSEHSMKTLTLDGVSVTTSGLSHATYKAAPCGLLLNITPNNLDEGLHHFRKAGFAGAYSGLCVSGVANLDFLEEFPDTLYLEVRNEKPTKTKALQALGNLRALYFESPATGINLSWFPELEVYSGGWHKEHINFDDHPRLRRLALRRFNPKSLDFSPLANNRRLERLEIIRSTASSLDGIETLEDLRILDLAYLSKLESLDALTKFQQAELRSLSIERAKNIKRYEPIASLTRLKDLKLSGCRPMHDLKWTRGMNWLEHFAFVETNVADGDLDPLLDLTRLRYIGTEDKRHYSHKMHEFIDLLANR